MKILLHSHFSEKSHQSPIILCNTIFQPIHLKANGHSISENHEFWSIPFQVLDYDACELSLLEFTAPKKDHVTYFLWTNNTLFKGNAENHNLKPTPLESCLGCGCFEPKGCGQTYTKRGAIIMLTLWQSNISCKAS